MLDHLNHRDVADGITSKDQLHYLLRDKSLLDVPSTVLENIARIDGAVVLCRDANLLAFGAILHHHTSEEAMNRTVEGGRTTAAIAASHYGTVLKNQRRRDNLDVSRRQMSVGDVTAARCLSNPTRAVK